MTAFPREQRAFCFLHLLAGWEGGKVDISYHACPSNSSDALGNETYKRLHIDLYFLRSRKNHVSFHGRKPMGGITKIIPSSTQEPITLLPKAVKKKKTLKTLFIKFKRKKIWERWSKSVAGAWREKTAAVVFSSVLFLAKVCWGVSVAVHVTRLQSGNTYKKTRSFRVPFND